MEMLNIISLGGGVQSTTMALMAARGELAPMPDCAIFADTQAEPKGVYEHLDWLETELPFPVHRVTVGSLREQILLAMEGKSRMDARPPFFVASGGMLHRQCTQDFKIIPIVRKVRELIGLKKGRKGPKEPVVEQWIGISMDEAVRMKPSRLSFIRHRWPLVERDMARSACLRWFNDRYPGRRLVKSACTFCPYTDDERWRDMKLNDPELFGDAVMVDGAIRPGIPQARKPTEWFLHRSMKPLAEVDLSNAEDRGQLNLFVNECEGMCGV